MWVPFRGRHLRAEAKARALAILRPYSRPGYWHFHRRMALTLLGFITFFYGFFFAVTTTYLLVQLVMPIIVLALLVVWMLPETGNVPTRLMTRLFFTAILVLFWWPDYLAITLPGLPWITISRLVTAPMAIIFLLCLSQSEQFRSDMKEILDTSPTIWKLVVAFSLLALLSIGFSSTPAFSINKYITAMLAWPLSFFVAVWVFAQPGNTRILTRIVLAGVVVMCAIGLEEARESRVLWAGHLPAFLKPEDEVVDKILGGSARSSTGMYRVQGKFTTPLGLAEMIVYTMPVILHMAFTEKRWLLRALCVALLPIFLFLIIKTDSRLGMIGFFSTLLLYLLFWAVDRWRHHRDSLFGPAVTLSFPVTALAFFAATFAIGRLHNVVWGTGAHTASNQGRMTQLTEGLPKVFSHPWGYGIGRGTETLGFTNPAGSLTIDNYYLLIALDYGVLGFLIYYSIFLVAIFRGAKEIFKYETHDDSFVAPIVIALINFVIIKSVFSQIENHALVFTYVGWLLALVYRIHKRSSLPQDKPLSVIAGETRRGRAFPAGARTTPQLAGPPAN
jgi:hypothetical protein